MSKVRPSPRGDARLVRIGEIARRAGVPAATLRAWERRYGVVSPHRGESGYRLYTEEDELRVRSMVRLIDDGLAPAEAARRVLSPGIAPPSGGNGDGDPLSEAMRDETLSALVGFDEEEANRQLDRAAGSLSVEAFVGDVVLPVLRELGERWERDEVTIAQEHFASGVLRGRLLGLSRGWGRGDGSLALLACPSGEHHDLGVLCFGLILRANGWRVSFLGGDTPADSILDCVSETRPDVVVVFAMVPERLEGIESTLERIAAGSALMLAGPGTDAAVSGRVGAVRLEGDPVAAAAALAV